MREKILVTGSSGLIGTAVCADLAARGHAVRRFDLRDRQGGHGDIRNRESLERALTGCTGVIHLAAVSRVIWGERDAETCHQTNVVGTRIVIDGIRSADHCPWLVFGSSREVYGQSPVLPVLESAALAPLNHYARSKLAAERAVQAAAEAGVRAAIVRFSTVYGSSADHADRVVPAFCRAAVRDLPLRVEGEARCVDITHVSDVAACVGEIAAGLSLGRHFEPMHLTTGRGVTLLDLANTVIRIAESKSPITLAPGRDFDVARFVGDPHLAQAQVGWRPQTSLETGLLDLITQYRKRAIHDR